MPPATVVRAFISSHWGSNPTSTLLALDPVLPFPVYWPHLIILWSPSGPKTSESDVPSAKIYATNVSLFLRVIEPPALAIFSLADFDTKSAFISILVFISPEPKILIFLKFLPTIFVFFKKFRSIFVSELILFVSKRFWILLDLLTMSKEFLSYFFNFFS